MKAGCSQYILTTFSFMQKIDSYKLYRLFYTCVILCYNSSIGYLLEACVNDKISYIQVNNAQLVGRRECGRIAQKQNDSNDCECV